MRWSVFLMYNAAGGILWAIVYGCLGFFAGRVFHDNFGAVEHLAGTISWVGAGLLVAGIILLYLLVRMRRRQTARKAVELACVVSPAASDVPETAEPVCVVPTAMLDISEVAPSAPAVSVAMFTELQLLENVVGDAPESQPIASALLAVEPQSPHALLKVETTQGVDSAHVNPPLPEFS